MERDLAGFMKCNEKSELLLSFLVGSEKRKNLLLFLHEGPKTLQEIRECISVSSAGIIPEIRKMENRQLIYQSSRKYMLTEIGKIISEFLLRFEKILKMFGNDMKFWSEHNISGIPEEFCLRLYELGNYEICRSTPTDIFRPQNEYLRNLSNASWMKGASPVLHPNYPKYIMDLADKGVPVSVILTKDLLEKIKEMFKEELKSYLDKENFKIMVCDENIGIAFSVTDFFLSMRLFLNDDTYDYYQNILSFDKSAIRWGGDMFSYFETRSKKLKLEDI